MSLTRSPAYYQIAGGDLLQPGDHSQERGLAAAGGAHKDSEFFVFDLKINTLDDLDLAKGFTDVFQKDFCHIVSSISDADD